MPPYTGAPSAYTGRHGQTGATASRDFGLALAEAENPIATALLDSAYRQMYGPIIINRLRSRHTAAQAAGSDVTLALANGTLRVEEKWRPGRGHWDVALETHHVYSDGSIRAGWLHTYPLPADGGPDLIAYAFGKTSTVILLPWAELAEAYHVHGREWRATAAEDHALWQADPAYWRRWRTTSTSNDVGYTSHCLVVPLNALQATVPGLQVIRVGTGEAIQ